MKLRSRLLAGLLVVVASTCVALSSSAEEQKIRGWGIVMSRSVTESTLGIDDRVYRVTPRTTFRDIEGGVITFDGFAVFDVHKGPFALSQATKVEYRARLTTSGWMLDSVRLVDQLPR